MRKIIINYIYNLLYQVLVLIIPLITAPYLAKTLGADALGEYSYVHSLTALVCTFVMLGIYNYGNRQIAYVRDDREKINTCFWRIMSARMVIAIIGTIVFMIIVLAVNRYETLFLIYYTYLLAYFIDCTWLYVGVEDMKWAVIKNLVTKSISVGSILIFVKEPEDIGLYVFIQGGSILISNLLAYSQLHRYVGRPRLIFGDIKADLKGSFLLFLPSIASTLYAQCDKIMIEAFDKGTRQVAFYDYSEKIVMIPLTFITVLSTVMMPRIANEFKKDHHEKIRGLLIGAAKISMMVAFPMMVGLAVVTDKLIPWYLGEEFLPTIQSVIIMTPLILTNTLSGISGRQYFTAVNRVDILIKAQFSAAVCNIIINAILIPKYGFMGAAYATIICSIVCAGIQMYYLNKYVPMDGLFHTSIKYLFFSVVMGAGIRILTSKMSPTPGTNIIQLFVGVTVYFALCGVSKDPQFRLIMDKFLKIINSVSR